MSVDSFETVRGTKDDDRHRQQLALLLPTLADWVWRVGAVGLRYQHPLCTRGAQRCARITSHLVLTGRMRHEPETCCHCCHPYSA
jgi:hypothetical protein